MKLLALMIFELLIVNIQFLVSRYTSVFEIQPMVLLVLAIYIILKADDAFLLPAILVTGFFLDCFCSHKIGSYLTSLLLCALLLRDIRNVIFADHFLTHVFFVFVLSMVITFVVYVSGGVVAFRAPMIIAVYNALLTPLLYYIFSLLRVEYLIQEHEYV